MSKKTKIAGFKRFSDLKKKDGLEEVNTNDLGERPDTDSDRPMNPNLPNASKKIQRMASRKNIIPKDQNIDLPSEDDEIIDEKVEFYGKVAKFPKKVKPSKAYNFLESVKISKNSIWYILVERQDDALQMVKYNNKKGFDLSKFVTELKTFYTKKYAKEAKISKLIESIEVSGAEEFSTIKNIPNIEVDGKKLIAKITEDLIQLLSK